MNWEAIGAIGEVGGAIAVVLTLVYLARQIRASATATRRAAMQEVLDQLGYWLDTISGNRATASAWGRGLAGEPNLDADEQVQFRTLAHRLTLIMERIHYMAVAGELEPWIVEDNERAFSQVAYAPGYRAWFRIRAHYFNDEFRAYIERFISNPPTDPTVLAPLPSASSD